MKVIDNIMTALICTFIILAIILVGEKIYQTKSADITSNHLVQVIGGDK